MTHRTKKRIIRDFFIQIFSWGKKQNKKEGKEGSGVKGEGRMIKREEGGEQKEKDKEKNLFLSWWYLTSSPASLIFLWTFRYNKESTQWIHKRSARLKCYKSKRYHSSLNYYREFCLSLQNSCNIDISRRIDSSILERIWTFKTFYFQDSNMEMC